MFRAMKEAQRELKVLNEGRKLCIAGRILLKLGSAGAYVAKKLSLTCFVAGTRIVTGTNADGTLITKAIEELRAGDTVLARDQFDSADSVQSQLVTQVFERETTHLRFLTVRDGAGKRTDDPDDRRAPLLCRGPRLDLRRPVGGRAAAK